jgi:hypothetical protein
MTRFTNDYRYDIRSFNWNKNVKVFTANAKELFVPGYNFPFPNDRKQFFIENTKTKGFRRFRLISENSSMWIFNSEDDILCFIIKPEQIKL